jgi:hypothetical protein
MKSHTWKRKSRVRKEKVRRLKTYVACHHEAVDACRVDDAELGNLDAGSAVLPSGKIKVHAHVIQGNAVLLKGDEKMSYRNNTNRAQSIAALDVVTEDSKLQFHFAIQLIQTPTSVSIFRPQWHRMT